MRVIYRFRESRAGRALGDVCTLLMGLMFFGACLAIVGTSFLGVLLRAFGAVLEKLYYYLPEWLVGVAVWEMVVVMGALLCLLRYTHRVFYGLAEFGMVLLATATALRDLDVEALQRGDGRGTAAFAAAIYLAVRAFDNVVAGLKEIPESSPEPRYVEDAPNRPR